MNSFIFQNPTRLIFGSGTISQLGTELSAIKPQKLLIVAGGGSIKSNGVYDQVVASLKAKDINWIEAWGVQANPTLEKLREIIALAQSEKVDAVLAVGGGSVIDTAKAVAAGFFLNDVWNAFIRKEAIKQALPLYTVLTLSATGSEMNGNAVITNSLEHKKWAISSILLYPKLTIIDPSVQSSLPFRQTVNGALDAIAHILEYSFMDSAFKVSLGINESLQRTIIEATDILQNNPEDMDARANLAWSATLALNGISGAGLKGGDWACHAIEHALSALNPKISHGEGLGVIFPAWIEFMAERKPTLFYRWAKEVWCEDSPSKAVRRFREKIESWGAALSLRDLGIREEDLQEIADIICLSPSVGALSKFNRSEIEAFLMLAY